MRVLLVRTSALGDVVHALPVASALARHRPEVRLGWVVDEAFAPLLAGHGLVSELLVAPLRRARRRGERAAGLRDLFRFLARLRAFRADVALDLMGNHKGALLARLSGARRRLGWARADRRERSSALWINEPVSGPAGHAVDRGLALVRALGLPDEPADFAPERLACGRDRVPRGDYVFVHPGAAWGNKRYPPEAWGRAAAGIAARTTIAVRIGAAPGEEALADAVVAAAGGAAQRLDAPTLGDLAGALRGARLVLAGDTGAVHLARALGRPVLALHGPTDPDLHGPYGAPAAALCVRLPCSFCHRRMDGAKPCLLAISPEAVAARALELLG